MPVSRSAMQASDAGLCNRLLSLTFRGEKGFAQDHNVVFRLDLPENRRNPPNGIDDKRASLNAHIFPSVHVFFHPDTIGIDNLFVRIGQ